MSEFQFLAKVRIASEQFNMIENGKMAVGNVQLEDFATCWMCQLRNVSLGVLKRENRFLSSI